jgi:inorganic pyrophosphatase
MLIIRQTKKYFVNLTPTLYRMKNIFSPWHNVSPSHSEKDTVNGIIEIPKGTRAKYELDKESGLLRLDRVLYSSVYYPQNYGFIPQSYCDDKDPLDILILSQIEVVPLCIVPAKVIGVMRMLDNGEADDKIIAVAAGDPSVCHYNDISEVPQHFKTEMMNFFQDYKKLEKKTVVVEEFFGKDVAIQILEESFRLYEEIFLNQKKPRIIKS